MKKFVSLFCLFLLIDMLLKALTFYYVPQMSWIDTNYPYGGFGIFHEFLGGISFSINYTKNIGAAWGMFSSYSFQLLILRLIIVTFMTIYAIFLNKEGGKNMPFLLIITGAIGNILSYFVFGHVIDMFHFNFWGYTFPIFNFADILITCGIGILFLYSFLPKKVAA